MEEVTPRKLILIGCLLPVVALPMLLVTSGCGGNVGPAETSVATESPASPAATDGAAIPAPTLDASTPELTVVPTLPDVIPGYTEVDPATGLYVTGTPQVIDLAAYRLTVTGKVSRQLSLTFDELRSLPKVTAAPRLVCAGVFVDTATWSGASFAAVLELAGVHPDAQKIKMISADGYWVFLSLEEALRGDSSLAYELMGQPLPVLHGFPLRAVIPAKNGNLWVKWLQEIVVEQRALKIYAGPWDSPSVRLRLIPPAAMSLASCGLFL